MQLPHAPTLLQLAEWKLAQESFRNYTNEESLLRTIQSQDRTITQELAPSLVIHATAGAEVEEEDEQEDDEEGAEDDAIKEDDNADVE
ncbi:hypothetical protein BO86DRAFT_394080 [Aspergillus japonicus CBS 114.51]|uniref:Uncharacterized protein n=1 Tax=Aspergillus japonicus CBS 114.51 TaxID=1448312 RepID=A0A8T8XG81_ASPJA|nr:hypothetical protein BO86DRAFT_394080 [Aspergillus japonicus CBS 114.51]RAH87276.1 hypothetical protein BO86DRAFT_394080 [Aspergillus japonicus CBS 114.51]